MYTRRHEVLRAVLRCVQPSSELNNPILVATLTVGVATLARSVLDPLLRAHGPYLFFAIAVILAALYAGVWAGIAAIILSIPICDYFFIEPRYTWFVHDARADSLMLGLFAALGVLTTFIIDKFHENRRQLKHSLLDLQRSESQLEMIDANVPEALFTATQGGRAQHLNVFFSTYSGQELHNLLGLGWIDLVHPDDRAPFLFKLSQQAEQGDQFTMTIRLRRSDGVYRAFKCHATRKQECDTKTKQWFGACSDVQNEKALAAALEDRTQELVKLNQSLERFAYAASHDLQEPLRTIGAMTELVLRRKGNDLDAESSRSLTSVVESAGRMKRLISDIMELATATNVAAEGASTVDMLAVAESAIANLGQAIKETGAKIVIERLPKICGNESGMLRLFQNIIANAIKYRSNRPPEVYISAETSDKEYLFSIKDNGIGIDPLYHEKIFEPFRRLHGRSQYEGSGLGLSACRRIVESLNGRIWVESKPGEGSTFLFAIPKCISGAGDKPRDQTQAARLDSRSTSTGKSPGAVHG